MALRFKNELTAWEPSQRRKLNRQHIKSAPELINLRDILLEEIKLEEIKSRERKVQGIETIKSTDEVTEFNEKDIEGFIERVPSLIGENISLCYQHIIRTSS